MPPPGPTVASEASADLAPHVLKEEPLSRLVRVRSDGRDVLRKEYDNPPGLLWRSWRQPSRGLRELRNLEAARAAGLPCVEPLAAGETRRRDCVVTSWVETTFVENTQPLEKVLEWMGAWPTNDPHVVRARLIRTFARLVRALHASGIVWTTCAYRNVLVRGRPRHADLVLCDLPWAVRSGRSQLGRAAARVDVRDLFFSETSRRLFTPGERFAGLIAYCAGDRAAARRVWRAMQARSPRRQQVEKDFVRFARAYARPALGGLLGRAGIPRVRGSGTLALAAARPSRAPA